MPTINPDLLTFLLNAAWQIPLAAAVAALLCRVMRDGPASHRHAVWVAALIAAVLLPVASVRPHGPGAPLHIDTSYLPSPDVAGMHAASAVPVRPSPVSESRIVSFSQMAAMLLWSAYLIFLVVRLGRFAWAWLRTVRLRRDAVVPVCGDRLTHVWERCSEAFGISEVELRASAKIPSPVTTGAWRKTVILPEALLGETSEAVLTTAVGHEMAHIARHDFAMNLVYELLALPVSFHPATWLIRRGIERTREMACDELVTRKLLEPGVYAEAMISIAAKMTGLPNPGCTLGVFGGDALEERIRRVLDRRSSNLKRARLLFATGLSVLAVCALVASSLALTARAQTESQTEMKLGGDAYNGGDFKGAVAHFGNAVHADPAAVKPKLFLANALMREYFAEEATPGSPLMADARRQYQDVLALDPNNLQAMQGLVVVGTNLKELNEAQEWAVRLVRADSGNKTAYYTAGVLDWAIVFPEYQRVKQAAGGKPQDYLIADPAVRRNLRDQYGARVQDGVQMMESALRLDPQYSDAMAYMNLLYRLKAGLSDNPSESAVLMRTADEWVGKAIAAKRARPVAEPAGATQLDVNGPPPGPASAQFVAAPPPPPPPPPRPPTSAPAAR